MKKLFTLAALAAMTLVANAQTESWSLTEAITTKDAAFNGKLAEGATSELMTLANSSAYIKGETANVTATYCSSPNDNAPESDRTSDLDECKEGKKTWVDLRANGSGNQIWDETFAHCIMGRGNPCIERTYWVEETESGFADRVTETYYEPTCGKLPAMGTYVEFEFKTAGTMEAILMVWRPNNALYVIDETTTAPLAPETVSFTGWYNNNTIAPVERTLNEEYLPNRDGDPGKQLAANFKFEVNAGKYMVLCPKSQIGFYGYKFTPSGSDAIKNVETIATNAAVVNLAGQQVANNFKGIVIKNGKKVLVK